MPINREDCHILIQTYNSVNKHVGNLRWTEINDPLHNRIWKYAKKELNIDIFCNANSEGTAECLSKVLEHLLTTGNPDNEFIEGVYYLLYDYTVAKKRELHKIFTAVEFNLYSIKHPKTTIDVLMNYSMTHHLERCPRGQDKNLIRSYINESKGSCE
jgi:hypothetical protein